MSAARWYLLCGWCSRDEVIIGVEVADASAERVWMHEAQVNREEGLSRNRTHYSSYGRKKARRRRAQWRNNPC